MAFRVGEWMVEPALDEIRRGSERVKLDPRTMAMFAYLIDRAGQVISPEELLDRVWSDTVVAQSSVYQAVAQLRRALGDDSSEPAYVVNVPRKGYRLIAPVSSVGASAGASNKGTHAIAGWPDSAPTEFDGLTLVRLIGEGSMGQVFLAREAALDRLVAVKFLRTDFANVQVVRARFEREARTTARVTHPNVATIYRVGERPDGVPYIAQEYVDGRTLADCLRIDGVRDIDAGTHILRSLAQALAAADAGNIIHRDVTPQNVLIERATGRAVLTDFGIAGFKDTERAAERLTRAGELLGDPRYASPEQIRGEALTPATDIYSLGIVAYELFLGRGPYDAVEGNELAQAHLKAPPLDPRTVRPDLPPALARAMLRCLEKRAVDRPTAAELVHLLDAESVATGSQLSTRSTARANWPRVSIVAVIVAAATAAILWSLWVRA